MTENGALKEVMVAYDFRKLALKIDEMLLRRGIKRRALAKMLNKTDSWMSQVMSGKIELTLSHLLEIARILEVDPANLLPGQGAEGKQDGLTLDDYIRRIARQEIEAANKDS